MRNPIEPPADINRAKNITTLRYLLSFLLLLFNFSLHAQIITTVAGNGTNGYTGDGGPAINARLSDMYYCTPAIDNAGNIYIAQTGDNTIRKIDVSGIITTIAGKKGLYGYSGDGGLATDALLHRPNSIVADNAGNIIFTDAGGTCIRKIDASGIITTISGLWINNCGAGDGGPLASAQFKAISSLTMDQSGNLYISDYGCNIIRKVNTSGIVTTIAGNKTYGFSGDGGPATSAQLAYPGSTAIDNAGNVYVSDIQNHRIRKISTTGIITTIAGNGGSGYSGDGGQAINSKFAFPGSVVVDNSGNLYVGDYNHVIRKIDPSGIITTYAGNGVPGYSGDGGPAILASMVLTEGKITIDANDNIYFVNYQNGNVIRKIINCITPSISQQPSDIELCGAGNATFSIAASNVVGYEWQLDAGNGWNDLVDDAVYSGSGTGTLFITGATTTMTNYKYRCAVTNICGTIFSMPGLLTVEVPTNPSLTITTSSTINCEGASVIFAAAPAHEGSLPVFEWKKNGVTVQVGSRSYTDNYLVDGDIISCVLTSNANCLIGNTAVSNALTMTVTPKEKPTLTMVASDNNICSGKPVTFTSTATHAGSAPLYTWIHNGVNLFINSPTYTSNSVNNGDVIMCAMLSSLTCVVSPFTTSLAIPMAVTPSVQPSVTIAASANAICKNTTVEFTATALNEGLHPVYQWKKNGSPVGSNNKKYIDNSLVQTDVITCTLTSDADCTINTQATSNAISITIHPDPVVSLDHSNTLCAGSGRTLDAGNFNSYLWNTGSTDRTILVGGIGMYSVIVTDKNGCTGADFTNITTILPPPAGFLPPDTDVCTYGNLLLKPSVGFNSYLWSTGSTDPSISIKQPGEYRLRVKDQHGCNGTDTIIVLPRDCLKGFFMPTAFTPNHDGKNDMLKPILLGNVKQYQFQIYNRWGQLIFQSNDPTKGWDGNLHNGNQNSNTFVWRCVYQLEGESVQNMRGSVILIR
ncbi:NHL domain-containing protein [Flavitalea sp.]|nr:T9SS type B sorting domain-containing protein [Flavitalea sp.]